MQSCPFCGRCFKKWKANERALHIARHQQPLWHTFQTPQFSLNKRPAKLRVVEEEKQAKADTFKKVAIEKPVVQEVLSSNSFRKRPTARKSHGLW